MTVFEHVPHPRVAARKDQPPPTVHGQHATGSPAARLNAKVALGLTLAVGTMWCAYVFALIAVLSAPSAFRSGNMTVIVAWVSSNFIQLVLLPVIIVGQNLQAKAADARAQQTYDDAEAILHEAAQLQAHLAAQDALLEKIRKSRTQPRSVR